MKSGLFVFLLGTSVMPAGSLILSDNFNAPDTANFDQSDQTGRRSGLLGPEVQLRSSLIQHGITGNQVNFLTPGRIRFQQVADLPATNVWTDFAGGVAGTTILAEGGLRISLDWIPADTTSQNWLGFSSGIAGMATAEPAIRVNHAGTDFGVLFRNNGGTQFFRNGAATTGSPFPVPSLAPRKVVITLAFDSFADGANVLAKATVDGVSALPDGYTFQWAGNGGQQFIELETRAAGSKIDNVSISGLTGISTSLSAPPFYSSIANNGVVGTLTSEVDTAAEPASYTLVAGQGDTDNSKFKISGNQLQSNGFNFQGLADGSPFSVRIRSTSLNGALTTTQTYALTLVEDGDSDDLPDSWEFTTAGNLTDLKGRNATAGPGAGSGNFDGDTLTDQQEFQLTRGLYPLLSPLLADTDGDGLQDGVELNPTGTRVVTNPTLPDTDFDGLNDQVENNSGTFESAAKPGTSPVDYDSDDDNFPDQYEIVRGTNPLNNVEVPTLPAPLTASVLTTDETSGISGSKTYTHKISGGYGAIIGGVLLDPVKPAQTAPDFTWTATTRTGATATFNEIAPQNFGEWTPAGGGLTGAGLTDLFGGFIYSGNGDLPGSFQTYTLSNLTLGQKYLTKLYVRVWSKVASGRPISLTFANGAQTVNAYVLQDRPGIMLGDSNPDSAYALAFPFIAEATEMTITAAVPLTTIPVSGSWHLYGLTNETVSDSNFAITNITVRKTPAPTATITFNSVDGGVYAVDASTTLSATGQPGGWTRLGGDLLSQGSLTTYTDTTAVATGTRIFYRVRRLSP